VKRPQDLDIVIFRQNDEDVYAGIEFKAKSKKAKKLRKFLNKMGAGIRKDSAIGIKPLSEFGSKRLITRAIEYAIEHGRTSVTLVGKGNIQKYTEGAFQAWGMEVAKKKFADKVISWAEVKSKYNGKLPEDKIAFKMVVIDEKIADATFADLLGKPTQFSVIATTNLNGDYLSDAAAAQVGGLGIAPGANIGKNRAIFEATHGTAPDIAGQNKANPCSLLLSAKMMLEYLGWHEAADILEKAIKETIAAKTVTGDLARLMENATTLGTDQFAQKITDYITHGEVNGEKYTAIRM
jgi:isocitrate dehydrogenase